MVEDRTELKNPISQSRNSVIRLSFSGNPIIQTDKLYSLVQNTVSRDFRFNSDYVIESTFGSLSTALNKIQCSGGERGARGARVPQLSTKGTAPPKIYVCDVINIS